MKGRTFIDSTILVLQGFMPWTVRSHTCRDRQRYEAISEIGHQICDGQSCTLVVLSCSKNTKSWDDSAKKIYLFTYDVACRVDLDLDLVSHNVAGWQQNTFYAACKSWSTSCRFMIIVGKLITTQAPPPTTTTTPGGLSVAVGDRDGCHKWFGCIFFGNNSGRHTLDFEYHFQGASKTFFANRNILCNEAVSLVKRLQFIGKKHTSDFYSFIFQSWGGLC